MNNEAPFFALGCLVTFCICLITSLNMNVPIHPSSYAAAEEACINSGGLREWSKDNFLGTYQAEFTAYCSNGNTVDFTVQARKAIKTQDNE